MTPPLSTFGRRRCGSLCRLVQARETTSVRLASCGRRRATLRRRCRCPRVATTHDLITEPHSTLPQTTWLLLLGQPVSPAVPATPTRLVCDSASNYWMLRLLDPHVVWFPLFSKWIPQPSARYPALCPTYRMAWQVMPWRMSVERTILEALKQNGEPLPTSPQWRARRAAANKPTVACTACRCRQASLRDLPRS